MLPAPVREELSGGPGFAACQIFVAATNSLGGFREVLAIPLQIDR
jgi:hypothetical protein